MLKKIFATIMVALSLTVAAPATNVSLIYASNEEHVDGEDFTADEDEPEAPEEKEEPEAPEKEEPEEKEPEEPEKEDVPEEKTEEKTPEVEEPEVVEPEPEVQEPEVDIPEEKPEVVEPEAPVIDEPVIEEPVVEKTTVETVVERHYDDDDDDDVVYTVVEPIVVPVMAAPTPVEEVVEEVAEEIIVPVKAAPEPVFETPAPKKASAMPKTGDRRHTGMLMSIVAFCSISLIVLTVDSMRIDTKAAADARAKKIEKEATSNSVISNTINEVVVEFQKQVADIHEFLKLRKAQLHRRMYRFRYLLM